MKTPATFLALAASAVLAAPGGAPVVAIGGGSYVGGDLTWCVDPVGRPTGVYAVAGAGRVAAFADGNAFADHHLPTLENLAVLDAAVAILGR